jgi:hypothetical protein
MRDEKRVREVRGIYKGFKTVGLISFGDLAAMMNQSQVSGRVSARGCDEQESMRLINIARRAQIFPVPGRKAAFEIEAGRLSR